MRTSTRVRSESCAPNKTSVPARQTGRPQRKCKAIERFRPLKKPYLQSEGMLKRPRFRPFVSLAFLLIKVDSYTC